jgi:hypothetical protein
VKQKFDLEGPGRLDRPFQKTNPRVEPQLPSTRSPESLHGLQRNFGNSWVTSCGTSTSRESTRIAHNQEESKKSLILVKNSPDSKNHQIESDLREIWRHKILIRDTYQKPQEIILKTPQQKAPKITTKKDGKNISPP